jgi:transcriptional regulator with XRE-family HTH domain
MTTDNTNKTIHHGRNVKRFREMLNIKQEGLAISLGDDWNQKKVSLLEQKEVIDDDVLGQVAKVLNVPAEVIKNFDAQEAIYNIQNNYDNAANNVNYQFNPIDKIVQLYDEKIALYERMIKDKSDMIEKLEELLLKGKS